MISKLQAEIHKAMVLRSQVERELLDCHPSQREALENSILCWTESIDYLKTQIMALSQPEQ